MTRKHPVRGGMRVRTYEVMRRAIHEGVEYGYRRAHKHTGKPDEFMIKDAIESGVASAIGEVFDFDDE